MSDDSNKRRNRIDRVNKAREAAGVTPMRRGYLTYWCTRDSVGGVVSDKVRVWLRQPKRFEFQSVIGGPATVRWYASREDASALLGEVSALYGEWELEHCRLTLGTIPDDDRMCIRREGHGGIGYARGSES